MLTEFLDPPIGVSLATRLNSGDGLVEASREFSNVAAPDDEPLLSDAEFANG
jgi:hypothetical protein